MKHVNMIPCRGYYHPWMILYNWNASVFLRQPLTSCIVFSKIKHIWHDGTRIQGISSHCTDLVLREYCDLGTRSFNRACPLVILLSWCFMFKSNNCNWFKDMASADFIYGCRIRSLNELLHKPGGWFNIKMPSYQYMKSHCADKTILRPSNLHNGISYTGKMTSLYWIRALAAWQNTRIMIPAVAVIRDAKLKHYVGSVHGFYKQHNICIYSGTCRCQLISRHNAHFAYGLNQWETMLHCNVVTHWLSPTQNVPCDSFFFKLCTGYYIVRVFQTTFPPTFGN